MSFNIKTWIDRVSEFPTRRLLTKVSDGTSEQVIVTRDEGTVTTAGDTFDANTMNNLEARIASAFTAAEQKMGDLADLDTTDKSSLVAAINEAAQSGGGGGGGGGSSAAEDITYDNTDSGLQATDVQEAIDEVAGGYVKKDFAIIEGTASIMATSTNDAAVNATGNDTHGANMGVYNSEVDGSMHMNMSTTGMKELVVFDGNANRSVIIAQDANGAYSGDLIDMIDEKADSTDLADYAPIASPDLTGTPTAPTAPTGTNTTQIATTAFIQAAIDNATKYKAGDVVNITGGIYVGNLAGSSRDIYIFIPLPKSTENVSGVSLTGSWYIRGAGVNVIGNASLSSQGSVSFTILPYGVQIKCNLNTASSAANNSVLGALAYSNVKLTFS